MSSPVHVTIQSVRLSWRIAGSDGSKSTIGLKDGGGFGTAKNSTPAQIGQKAQPAAVGRSCEAAEAINGNEGAGSGPRLLNSNRRREEATRECNQHEAAERIDRDVYRIDHVKIAKLTTVLGSQRACSLKGPQRLGMEPFLASSVQPAFTLVLAAVPAANRMFRLISSDR